MHGKRDSNETIQQLQPVQISSHLQPPQGPHPTAGACLPQSGTGAMGGSSGGHIHPHPGGHLHHHVPSHISSSTGVVNNSSAASGLLHTGPSNISPSGPHASGVSSATGGGMITTPAGQITTPAAAPFLQYNSHLYTHYPTIFDMCPQQANLTHTINHQNH